MDTWIAGEMLDVWRLLGTLLGTLALIAASLWAGARVTEQARALWRALRGHRAGDLRPGRASRPADRQLARLTAVPPGCGRRSPAFLALAAGWIARWGRTAKRRGEGGKGVSPYAPTNPNRSRVGALLCCALGDQTRFRKSHSRAP